MGQHVPSGSRAGPDAPGLPPARSLTSPRISRAQAPCGSHLPARGEQAGAEAGHEPLGCPGTHPTRARERRAPARGRRELPSAAATRGPPRAGPRRGRAERDRRVRGSAADHMGRVRLRFPAPRPGGRDLPRPTKPGGTAGPTAASQRLPGSGRRGRGALARPGPPRAGPPRWGPLGSRVLRPRLPYRPGRASSGVCARTSSLRRAPIGGRGRGRWGQAAAGRTTGAGEPELRMDKPPKHFRRFPRGRERARKRSKMAASQPLRTTSRRGVRTADLRRPALGRRAGRITCSLRGGPTPAEGDGAPCRKEGVPAAETAAARWTWAPGALKGRGGRFRVSRALGAAGRAWGLAPPAGRRCAPALRPA